MNPFELSAIVFACVFGGAMLGMALRTVVPEHHLNSESKDVVKLGVGLIGTMAALVLGLLVASAKSSYDARASELTQMSANAILLDRALAHYGSETHDAREVLKGTMERLLMQIWPQDSKSTGGMNSNMSGEVMYDELVELTPHTDAQRAIQSLAESTAFSLAQTRWLLFEQNTSSISTPFLVVVVFWLSVLFLSFGLFAPHNATVVVTLLLSAISVAGALFLIFELDRPFSGLIQISSAPLRNALAVMGK